MYVHEESSKAIWSSWKKFHLRTHLFSFTGIHIYITYIHANYICIYLMQFRCKKCNLQGTTFKTTGLAFVLLTAFYYAVAELKES